MMPLARCTEYSTLGARCAPIEDHEGIHQSSLGTMWEPDECWRPLVNERVQINGVPEENGVWRVLRVTTCALVKRRDGEAARWYPLNMVAPETPMLVALTVRYDDLESFCAGFDKVPINTALFDALCSVKKPS